MTRRGRRASSSRARGRCWRTSAAALVERDLACDDLRVIEPSLEDVFLKLTGHLVED